MCGRFTLKTAKQKLLERMGVATAPPLEPRYNIAPTQPVPIVRVVRMSPESRDREIVFLRWGLIPSWADDPAIGNRLINARAETVAEKPAYRSAFHTRRCLIDADGFFEWAKQGPKK